MKTKFNVILTLVLAFMVQISFAQSKTISGIVSDKSGPLPEVNVQVTGSSSGTTTDFDGNYSIQAKDGDIVTFSYVGYKTETRTVSSSSINITMVFDQFNVLDEVIVTGYGAKKRDVISSAVSLITADEIEALVPTTSIDNMLQGKAAGVQVTAANGQPGATAFTRIRGTGSLNAGASSPLYIVDGSPMDEQDLNAISATDVASISILKDAATASLYGSRGSNGVVLITTKRGKKNRAGTLKYTSRVGFTQKIKDNFSMMNSAQKLDFEKELADLGVPAAFSLPGNTATAEERQLLLSYDHDWQDTLLRQGLIQSNALSFSGGSETTTYFLSVSHDKNTGIVKNLGGFERLNARLSFDADVKDWLKIGASASYSRSTSDDPRDRNNVQNPFRASYDYNQYEPVFSRDTEGNVLFDENGDPEWNFNHTGFLVNEAILTNTESSIQNIMIGNVFTDIKISNSLSNKTTFSVVAENFRDEYFNQPGSRLDFFVGDGIFLGSKRDNGFQETDFTISNLLNYKFSNDKHNFSATGLFEYNKEIFTSYVVRSSGFTNVDLSTQANAGRIDSGSTGRTELALVSYGVFTDYNFKEKYIATASVRYDGSSNFGVESQYGIFWSASAAWNVAKEDFFKSEVVDDLKLRISLGTSGNRTLSSNRNANAFGQLSTVISASYPGGNSTLVNNVGNVNLGWEETLIADIGVEYSLFNKRVTGVIDYFKRNTSDLISSVPTADEAGTGSVLQNLGEIENSGIEFELQAKIIRKNDFSWTIGGNIALLKNKIIELPDNDGDGVGDDVFPNSFNTVFREGEPINSYFLVRYAGVDSETGRPLYFNTEGVAVPYFDDNGEVQVEAEILDKSPAAKLEGGVFSQIRYKGFDLRTDFVFKGGNYINNFVKSNVLSDGTAIDDNQAVGALNYWKNPGDTGVLPSPLFGTEAQQSSDRFLQKGDYVRLRNLTLAYNFENKFLDKTPFKSLRVYLQGQNLWTSSDFFGDPEVGISSGETISQGATVAPGEATLYSYPNTKSYSIGIDIKF